MASTRVCNICQSDTEHQKYHTAIYRYNPRTSKLAQVCGRRHAKTCTRHISN
jgi:hypothetical protein